MNWLEKAGNCLFMKVLLGSRYRIYYLSLVFLFMFGDIICNNNVLKSAAGEKQTISFISFLFLSILQTFASPIQAAFSDLYCRKKSLVFSLIVSSISLILLYFFVHTGEYLLILLFFIISLKGLAGNTLPLSFAAIADIKNKNIRLFFGIATLPYTAAYFFLIFANKTFSEPFSVLLSIGAFILFVALCCLFFYDQRDKTNLEKKVLSFDSSFLRKLKKEIEAIRESIRNLSNRMAFISYLLWEISLYSILLPYVDFGVKTFSTIGIAMLIGAGVAVLVLKFCEMIDDERLIKWGYNLSAYSLVPFFLIRLFTANFNFYILSACYFFHTMGNILLSASLFALMAKKTPPHECGKIYGLFDSVDTIAFLIASLFIMVYNYFQFDLIYLILFSYLTVTASWIPYARFKKIRTTNN
jgi:MFS family permease